MSVKVKSRRARSQPSKAAELKVPKTKAKAVKRTAAQPKAIKDKAAAQAQVAADKAAKAKAAEEKKATRARVAAEKAAATKKTAEQKAAAAAAKTTSGTAKPRKKKPLQIPPDPLTIESIGKQIRQAYLSETRGAVKERVLLKDLRPKVGVQREDFDQALLAMQQQSEIVLMGLDNPMERTPEVEAAALHIAGHPRHLVYFQG
jgi:hypothetical protein